MPVSSTLMVAFFAFTYDNSNLAAIKGILHGIGEQVGDNLVKVDAVYPNLQLAFIAAEAFVFFELRVMLRSCALKR